MTAPILPMRGAGMTPAPWSPALQSAPYCVLDIETAAGSPESIERSVWHGWRPDVRWGDETIGRRFREALLRAHEKGALLDSAPIAAVGLRAPGATLVLHAMAERLDIIPAGWAAGYADERGLMASALDALDSLPAECRIVGHNVYRFDLPRMRLAAARHDLALPPALTDGLPVTDTMHHFCRNFAAGQRVMIGVEEMLELLGAPPRPEGAPDGADVPAMVACGDVAGVAAKLAGDLVDEEWAARRMGVIS
ncbi:MAG: hypothetical protein ACRD1M_06820 [Terriglobales bacterium]